MDVEGEAEAKDLFFELTSELRKLELIFPPMKWGQCWRLGDGDGGPDWPYGYLGEGVMTASRERK